MSDRMSRESKFNLWGWLLFIVCAIFFIASATINGDILYLIGSIVFLFACLIFILPLVIKRIKDEDD
jgi:uncharacterized membrane protein YhaH (DUF805 family)